jgi:ribonuclease T2
MIDGAARRWRAAICALFFCAAYAGFALPKTKAAGTPGEFDYYVLALSWSPSFCANISGTKKSAQCSGTRPFAFVLHGLWPQYESGWPDYCDTAARPFVPHNLINSMLDIMPARGLVIHQYKKHGVCSGLDPEHYFRAAREAFERIKIPARYLSPRKPVIISPREIENDFLKTNQALTPDMISIACGRNKRLREVRICFSNELRLTPCGANERQEKLCRMNKVIMPPVRGQ